MPRTAAESGRFVVHEHRATRLHYDFRLELDGVLKSWAVPGGPLDEAGRAPTGGPRADHPVSCLGFEGVIPEGQYGAGPVVVWDRGAWVAAEEGSPSAALRRGRFAFVLRGRKLRGGFVLARLAAGRTGKEWLLVKKADEQADPSWRIDTEFTPGRLRVLRPRTPPCESACRPPWRTRL